MKNYLLVYNVILTIAVIVLFILVLGNKKNIASEDSLVANDSIEVAKLPIAYINIDSLLLNYTFAKEANENLMSKQENSKATLNSKARQLQNEMDEFNRKLENNAFLSRERAEQAQRSILQKQQDLQNMEGRLSQDLMESQLKVSEQLRDTIESFLQIFNKGGKYQIILSNTSNDNILFSTSGYDITEEVIVELNKRYKK